MAISSRAQEIASSVAEKYGLFECVDCAAEIVRELKAAGIRGEIIEISTMGVRGISGNIWSETVGKNISENGRHLGVLAEGKVYDNIHHGGIGYEQWVADKASPTGFKIKKTPF